MSTELFQPSSSPAIFDDAPSLETLAPTALEIMERAQIDVQIATARRYPRSMANFLKRGQAMVSIDEETAASCIYRRPVGKERGQPVYAEGESVRLAEIVAACFGNIRASARIIEQTERKVTAIGFAHDLETNYAVQVEAVEVTVKRDGSPYDERMRMVIAKAALSKAFRDAVFRVVPKSLCKPISKLAREVAVGDAKTLASRRQAVLDWINKAGAEPARVFARLGINGADEINLDHLETLTGIKTAVKDGDVTIDEAFPTVPGKVEFNSAPTPPAPIAPAALPPARVPQPPIQQPAPVVEVPIVPAPSPEVQRGEPAKPQASTAPAPPMSPEKEATLAKIKQRLEDEKLPQAEFEAYLHGRGMLEANRSLEHISLPRLSILIDKVGEIATEIKGQPKLAV